MKLSPQPLEAPWLEESLRDFFSPGPEIAPTAGRLPPAFREQCLAAGERCSDITRMRGQRPGLAAVLSPLADHFLALAQLAGVKIEQVYAGLGIDRTKALRPPDAPGLARLARALGLGYPETDLRLRLDFAAGLRSTVRASLMAQLVPAFARRGNPLPAARIEAALRDCETSYSAARRARLQAVRKAVAAVFATAEN